MAGLGLRDAADAELWSYFSAHDSILISKGEDFANMVLQKPTVRLIWVRVGNCRRVFLLDLFRQVWPRIMDQSQPYPDMPTQMEQRTILSHSGLPLINTN